MCDPVTATVVTAAVVGGAQVYEGEKNRKMQDEANKRAMAAAGKQNKLAEEANNRANARQPDAAAMLSGAMTSGKAGQSGTMLTSPAGIDPTKLLLGKTTLLGA